MVLEGRFRFGRAEKGFDETRCAGKSRAERAGGRFGVVSFEEEKC